jgi:hypothetical protein
MTVHPFLSSVSRVDTLLIDVAQRIQLSPTKHDDAQCRFIALCEYIDRPDSPMHGLIAECYGGGSFSTGTVIASKVSKNQHDVDAVVETLMSPNEDPSRALTLLFDAINGPAESRYHGKVRRNSRCVTVEYGDGVAVDLMPIARIAGEPARAGHLFHWRPAAAESYHKPVNPWGFAARFNEEVELDSSFARIFDARRRFNEGTFAKAATEPLPDHVPLSEKSARVVAIQLLKRNRDIRYRSRDERKPPSVMICALALEAGASSLSLVEQLLHLTRHIACRLEEAIRQFALINVVNPAYDKDRFTDRWPATVQAEDVYLNDLRHLERQLILLTSDRLTAVEIRSILENLFGETAARYAVERHLNSGKNDVETKGMRFGPLGQVLTGAAAAAGAACSTAARANTNMGHGCLPE